MSFFGHESISFSGMDEIISKSVFLISCISEFVGNPTSFPPQIIYNVLHGCHSNLWRQLRHWS